MQKRRHLGEAAKCRSISRPLAKCIADIILHIMSQVSKRIMLLYSNNIATKIFDQYITPIISVQRHCRTQKTHLLSIFTATTRMPIMRVVMNMNLLVAVFCGAQQ